MSHQPQYVHYTGPPSAHTHNSSNGHATVSPQETTRQTQLQQPQQPLMQQSQHPPSQQIQSQASSSTTSIPSPSGTSSTPLIATGDWTKDLVHLAKTAELKKHALTLQLHTAHILSAHASLEQKSKAIQDVREQKNKLESERTRLINCLREINEDRDKADLMEASLGKECDELRQKITTLTEGEYTVAKRDVDKLRQELGQQPLPNIQKTLDEKSSQYLTDRRLNGNEGSASSASKRALGEISMDGQPNGGKRPRGRPKGSKNKKEPGASTSAA